ncbi:MAG: acetylornithine transaminase [Spirochaetaceae bacterium]|nr:acetylornithine transaminase [Spirochaetaceae bacterium]
MKRDGAIVSEHPMPGVFTPELLVLDHGNGCRVSDVAGRSYLDFGGGIAVNALGYGRDDLAQAAADQMRKLVHVSNLYATEPALALAEKLIASAPARAGVANVQFTNSGSEANETALKYARLLASRGGKQGKDRIACFSGAFHGRTMGALSCTPTEKYQEPFAPLVGGVTALPFNDADAAAATLDDSFCAVIVEVVQGEGGLDVMSERFAHKLNELCRRHAIMLIADEVQTGLSRTGELYASSLVGLEPDLITLAKPLGGGLPLAATLIPRQINALLHIGDHGTTFGGGPVTCAVGNLVWDTVAAPEFVATVRSRGRYLHDALGKLAGASPMLGTVKGAGLLAGVTVTGEVDGAPAIAKLVPALRDAGMLALRSGDDVLRLAPPLIVSEAEIDEALAMIADAVAALGGE